jgi:3-phenylpropionate/trans-cinnamate dioxygenase ferredoxin reductase subunit
VEKAAFGKESGIIMAILRRDYLIVGAGVAGGSVCEGIRQYDPKGTVMLVGNDGDLPYSRFRLLGGGLAAEIPSLEDLRIFSPTWYAEQAIDARLDTPVRQLNLERHLAVLSTGQVVEFRKACLATGTRVHRPLVAGAALGNLFYLRSWRDLIALREASASEPHLAVVGGGAVAGLVAAQFAQRSGSQVFLVHRGKALWNRLLDEASAAWLTGYYESKGVQMRVGEALNGFEGRTALKNIQTKSGQRFPAGAAVVAFGLEMNLGLVANTPLSYPHGTPVNEFLETDEKGIYAAGAIAAYPDKIFGGVRRSELEDCARRQGLVAGANMTGKKRQRFDWMPHRTLTVFDLRFEWVGDFSRTPTRLEVEGDRASGQFLVRHFLHGNLQGVTCCNQSPEVVADWKDRVRNQPREFKRHAA